MELIGDSLDQVVPQMDGLLLVVAVDLDMKLAETQEQMVDMVGAQHPQEDLFGVVLEMV
tara:strand:- start:23 stop:199 length:177 start_codon:yes stop_codon:yes gene_type:complete